MGMIDYGSHCVVMLYLFNPEGWLFGIAVLPAMVMPSPFIARAISLPPVDKDVEKTGSR